jgi:hypothetical protein
MPSGTVNPAVGNRTQILVKGEQTWGELNTNPTPEGDWDAMPQTGNAINGTIELLDDPTIASGRFSRQGIASSDTIEGSMDFTVDPELVGFPLYYTLGGINESSTASGTGAYVHGFYGNDLLDSKAELPSFSVFRDLDKFNQRILGAKADTLSFDQPEADILTGSLDVVARSEENPPDAEAPATQEIDTNPFVYREANLFLDLGDGNGLEQVGNVVDISFEIANNLESEFTINSGKFIGVLVALERNITGSMTFKYETSDLYDAYVAGNDMKIEITWDTGVEAGTNTGENRTFHVDMPLVSLDTAPIDVGGGDEIVTQDIDFTADYNPNATRTLPDGSTLNGYDFYAELTNERSMGEYEAP